MGAVHQMARWKRPFPHRVAQHLSAAYNWHTICWFSATWGRGIVRPPYKYLGVLGEGEGPVNKPDLHSLSGSGGRKVSTAVSLPQHIQTGLYDR